MKPYVYAISDIHGMYDLFEKAIANFDPQQHQLVLIGDLNDRVRGAKRVYCWGKN